MHALADRLPAKNTVWKHNKREYEKKLHEKCQIFHNNTRLGTSVPRYLLTIAIHNTAANYADSSVQRYRTCNLEINNLVGAYSATGEAGDVIPG